MKKGDKWKDVSYVLASDYRMLILKQLGQPKTPSKLSKETNINKTHVSRALSELQERGLIICLTPHARKGRIFVIKDYGKTILEEAERIE